MVVLSWTSVSMIRSKYKKSIGKESKHSFSVREAERSGVTDVEIRRILNNQRWRDSEYEPYMPGYDYKLNLYDIRDIRKAFINKSPDISVKQFVELWALHKNVSRSQIQRIIYNKSWNDADYEPPRYRKKSNKK